MSNEPELECINEIAKAQVHIILNSWLYKKVGELETLKADNTVDKDYVEALETRLLAVKETQDKLLDMPSCKQFKLEGD